MIIWVNKESSKCVFFICRFSIYKKFISILNLKKSYLNSKVKLKLKKKFAFFNVEKISIKWIYIFQWFVNFYKSKKLSLKIR